MLIGKNKSIKIDQIDLNKMIFAEKTKIIKSMW